MTQLTDSAWVRTANHPGWIDGVALKIAQGIAGEQSITDVQQIARIQIGAIEGIKYALGATPAAEPSEDEVARAIYDAEDPHSGDTIGHTIHMSIEPAYEEGSVANQLENVMATCRSAARAAIAALREPGIQADV